MVMSKRLSGVVAAATVAVLGASLAFAQPAQPGGDGAQPPRAGRGGGGGGPGGGRFGGGMGMFMPDAFAQTWMALSELNMTPDFTLTKEQKTQLLALRDAHKKE